MPIAAVAFGYRVQVRIVTEVPIMQKTLKLVSAIALLVAASVAAAEQPQPGEPAPDFELRDQDGRIHSIEDYRGQWVALYFYPKDDTPGCTTEACAFRDDVFAFRDLNTQILGVSLDDVESHKEFAEKYSLPFPLLADTEGTTAAAYGVRSRMLGMTVAKRQTFLIDPDGNVARHYEKVDPESHSKQILADLEAMQVR